MSTSTNAHVDVNEFKRQHQQDHALPLVAIGDASWASVFAGGPVRQTRTADTPHLNKNEVIFTVFLRK